MSIGAPDQWYASHTTLVEVARWAVDNGELHEPEDVVDFFEKPWHYPELREGYVASLILEDVEKSYKVVRFFQADDKPAETLVRGLTLQQAQAHCERGDTRGEDWFDGFMEEDDES